jgi:sec-independent protein translocase protein TatA
MAPLGLFGSFGFQELLVILALAVFLFGAKRIPEVAKGLGEGIRGFKAALKGETETPPAPPARDDEASRSSNK